MLKLFNPVTNLNFKINFTEMVEAVNDICKNTMLKTVTPKPDIHFTVIRCFSTDTEEKLKSLKDIISSSPDVPTFQKEIKYFTLDVFEKIEKAIISQHNNKN